PRALRHRGPTSGGEDDLTKPTSSRGDDSHPRSVNPHTPHVPHGTDLVSETVIRASGSEVQILSLRSEKPHPPGFRRPGAGAGSLVASSVDLCRLLIAR